ncbi:MAG: DUF5596 domain-containing protein [Clostridia bacterium]|nr:DUF5596 domain-containing protein [Clostridia bacterium]
MISIKNSKSADELYNYICGFLKEYEYDRSSSDCLLWSYKQITNNLETNKLMEEILQLYNTDYHCDFDAIFNNAERIAQMLEIHEFTIELLVFICLSKHLKELYLEKGIAIEYYRKSMADLKYKLDECMLVYGIAGSFVADWFVSFFKLKRFGIGRLQFEIVPFGANYNKNGIVLTPDTKVINIHIPRSKEPLTEEACIEAYNQAKVFFKAEIDTDPCPFVCDSYLLYPENEKFLPPTTNTYRFFKSFDIISVRSDKERKHLWRIFDTHEKNIDRLPADTTMRRAFIEHLKKGGKMGEGRGILFI